MRTLGEFLQKQKELDAYFDKKCGRTVSERERLTNTLLALIVEVSETANEIRCFKDWSKKPPSEKPVILEEFADALHFLLSLANQLGFTEQDIVDAYDSKHDKNMERQDSGNY